MAVFGLTVCLCACGKKEAVQEPEENLPVVELTNISGDPDAAAENKEEGISFNETVEEVKVTGNTRDKYRAVTIRIPFGSNTEVLTGDMIDEWVVEGSAGCYLDTEKVRSYVNSLSKKYDTFGQSRKFTKTGGGTVTVVGGNYGWWMDRPETTAALVKAIEQWDVTEFKPVYHAEAAQFGESDIGNSYVEIDLDNQVVYVYKDGTRVAESPCVSGRVTNGNFTPDGTYAITYKERNASLVGEGYTSAVSYWMPFNGNIGMHDASWRSEFGGSIYVGSGSHGCVNLPVDKASQIYAQVEKGEAVVVYGGKQSKAEAVAATTSENQAVSENQPVSENQAVSAEQAAQAASGNGAGSAASGTEAQTTGTETTTTENPAEGTSDAETANTEATSTENETEQTETQTQEDTSSAEQAEVQYEIVVGEDGVAVAVPIQ